MCVGECMVELRSLGPDTCHVGYAGDTYNAAVYLRRVADQLGVEVEVGYLTGLGVDDFSVAMRAAWADEGVVDLSLTDADRHPGLYAIQVDDAGERRFTYWRQESAARSLLSGTAWLPHLDGDLIYLSGITVQLLAPTALGALRERLDTIRAAGTTVAFDTNYRPTQWPSLESATNALDAVAGRADVVLASMEDEEALHGPASPAAVAQRLAATGPAEVVVKAGADGAWVRAGEAITHIQATTPRQVADTTAAGDSFAGAYLAARLDDRSPIDAAEIAGTVAAVVVAHSGAIVPRDALLLEPD